MAVVDAAGVGVEDGVDAPLVVLERLEAFASGVLAGAMNRPVQVVNGGLYLQGLIEQARGSRWSRWSRDWVMLTIRACSSSWLIVRGIRRS